MAWLVQDVDHLAGLGGDCFLGVRQEGQIVSFSLLWEKFHFFRVNQD